VSAAVEIVQVFHLFRDDGGTSGDVSG